MGVSEKKSEPAAGTVASPLSGDELLIAGLLRCVEELMPGIGHVVIDIGFLNETLLAANKRLNGRVLP